MRVWAVLAAVAAIGLGGASQAPPPGHGEGGQQQHDTQRPRQDQSVTSAPQRLPTIAQSKRKSSVTDDGKENPERHGDSPPNWLAIFWFFDNHNGTFNAIAALVVAFFTFFLWRIGVRQTEILHQNAAETRDSILIARRSADAATASVALAEETMHRQLRAYISVELGDLIDMEAGKCPIGAVLVTNSGQTPAHNVSTEVVIELVLPGGGSQVPDHHEIGRKQLIVGPKHDKRSSQVARFSLTQHGLEDIKAGTVFIMVAGCTVYDDVFGKTWWTQFCHVYTGPDLAGRYHTELNRGI